MKKFTKILTLFMALSMCAFCFAACGNTDSSDSKGTIAVIAKGETQTFWQAVQAGAEQAGADLGYEITFQGPAADSEESVNEQREMVQSALNNPDTKAIVLAAVGPGFADELISAYDKGIPIVEFDSGLYSGGADITEGKDPTVGSAVTDNYAAAGFAAENFYQYLKDNHIVYHGMKIGILQHDSTPAGIDRANGFKDKIEALAADDALTLDIKIQSNTDTPGEYLLDFAALMDWGAEAVFMTDEDVVNEVYSEVSANADMYRRNVFCGFGAGTSQYNWIKNAGADCALLVGSVAQDSYNIGYKAVELAAKKLAGEAVSDVSITGIWYTAENVDELKDQKIVYMDENKQ